MQKRTDLDLHALQNKVHVYSGSAGLGLKTFSNEPVAKSKCLFFARI